MFGITYSDMLVAMPTWLAAYNGALMKASAEGKTLTEEQAIHAGDAAVRRSQGAGAAKDLSAIQRKRGAIRLFTMFYTPFAAQYGRLRQIGSASAQRGLVYAPEAIMRVLLVTMIPKIASDLLTSRAPDKDDDKEKWLKWIGLSAVTGLAAPLPFVRDVANGLERWILGKGGDTRYSPVADAIERIGSTLYKTGEAAFTDKDYSDELAFDTLESSGYLLGFPTAQPAITGEYLIDLLNGEARPKGVGDFMHDLLFRRKRKEREGKR